MQEAAPPQETASPLWLVGLRGATARDGTLEGYVEDRGVTGVVWTPAGVRPDDWTPGLHRIVEAGAKPDESLLHDFALTDVRKAGEALRFVWRDSDHADGWAAIWLPPDVLGDIGRATTFAQTVAEEVGRPNVAVCFLWTESRAGVVSALIAADVPLVLAGVATPEAVQAVERARSKGMERARRDAVAAVDDDEDEEPDEIPERTIHLLGEVPDVPPHLHAVRLTTEDVLTAPDRTPAPWMPSSQEQERTAFSAAVEAMAARLRRDPVDTGLSPAGFAAEVAGDCRILAELPQRIWARDFTVWRPEPDEVADRLGWLDVAYGMRGQAEDLAAFGRSVRGTASRIVLCGMGGSSLAPEVLATCLQTAVPLIVLDSTSPDHVRAVTESLDWSKVFCIVSSKSGTTVETLSHAELLWSRIGDGDRFAAITDPGSSLAGLARERNFRRVFENPPDIGGRFSALSYFGLVPAAVCGIDVMPILDGAIEMMRRCEPAVREARNPGLLLGSAIAEAFGDGRDKLTLVLPDSIATLGDWIEQLVAESTGKGDTGVLPVVGEPVGEPDEYGDDRIFVAYTVGDDEPDPAVAALAETHPVVFLKMHSPNDLGAEFFRWEFATAVLGHVLEINPFDQPDVEAAKVHARRALESGGAERPEAMPAGSLVEGLEPPTYVAIQAFLPPTDEVRSRLEAVAGRLRDRHSVAVTIGFGPRYLHSTGQLHKGGPDRGVFLQVCEPHASDLDVPGKTYTFGRLIDAQADGDVAALRDAGRRVARVTLAELEALAVAGADAEAE